MEEERIEAYGNETGEELMEDEIDQTTQDATGYDGEQEDDGDDFYDDGDDFYDDGDEDEQEEDFDLTIDEDLDALVDSRVRGS